MTGENYFWVLGNSYTRWLWKDYARFLRKKLQLKPLLLVATEEDRHFYTKQYGEDVDFEIVVLKNPYSCVVAGGDPALSEEDAALRAKNIEKSFDISIMRELVLSDRHLGRGFMLAGQGHAESRTSRASTLKLVHETCVAQFEFTRDLFDKYPPKLVVSYYSGGGIVGKPIALICRERNIPFRAICPARFGGLTYWAHDEFEGSPQLLEHLKKSPETLPQSVIEDVHKKIVPSTLATNAKAVGGLVKMMRYRELAKAAVLRLLRPMYGRWRGYEHALTGYLYPSVMAQLFRMRRHWRLLEKIAVRELPDLKGKKIVYFPLQQEPESSTLVLSPEHTNQQASIVELALTLPADAVLVVKEHLWQLGRRSEDMFDLLRQIPNVVFVHPDASSLDIIRRADVVCTISSSAGYEAAALGKHVVFFWKSSPLRCLPHVHIMSRFENLEKIRTLLKDDGEESRRKRVNDGALFFKRLEEFCIDLEPIEFHGRSHRPSDEDLEQISAPLLAEWAAVERSVPSSNRAEFG